MSEGGFFCFDADTSSGGCNIKWANQESANWRNTAINRGWWSTQPAYRLLPLEWHGIDWPKRCRLLVQWYPQVPDWGDGRSSSLWPLAPRILFLTRYGQLFPKRRRRQPYRNLACWWCPKVCHCLPQRANGETRAVQKCLLWRVRWFVVLRSPTLSSLPHWWVYSDS